VFGATLNLALPVCRQIGEKDGLNRLLHNFQLMLLVCRLFMANLTVFCLSFFDILTLKLWFDDVRN